jgi:hypothetical protein
MTRRGMRRSSLPVRRCPPTYANAGKIAHGHRSLCVSIRHMSYGERAIVGSMRARSRRRLLLFCGTAAIVFGSHADLTWHADLRLPPGGLPQRSIAIFPYRQRIELTTRFHPLQLCLHPQGPLGSELLTQPAVYKLAAMCSPAFAEARECPILRALLWHCVRSGSPSIAQVGVSVGVMAVCLRRGV